MLSCSRRRLVFVLGLLLVPIKPTTAPAQEITAVPQYEEVPLFFRHRPEVARMVIALFDGRHFYLPLIEILNHLQVSNSFEPTTGRLRVTFGQPQREYEIDFVNAEVRAAGRTVTLRGEHFVRRELEVYVVAEVLEDIFGMRARVDLTQLSVELTTREEMPVTAAARRRRQPGATSPKPETWDIGTHFARNRRLLDGAILGYLLNVSDGGEARGSLRLGMEALGGALDADGDARRGGGGRERANRFQLRRTQWRTVFDSRLVTQLAVGDVRGSDALQRPLKGIELSNRPVEVRRVVATQLIEGPAPSGWDVELLVNGVVKDRVSADALGRYRFSAPLGYGGSAIRLRLLGPDGEVREEEYWFEVPFAFTPRGRLDYTIAGGKTDDGSRASQADLAFGLTDRVSLSALLYKSDDQQLVDPVRAAASLRLYRGYIGRVEASSRERYRADLQATTSSRAIFSASYRQDPDRSRSFATPNREYGARAFVPLRREGMNGAFRLDLLERRRSTGSSQFLGTAEFSVAHRFVRPVIAYHVATNSGAGSRRAQLLRLGSTINIDRGPQLLHRLQLRSSASYDLEARHLMAREIAAYRGFSNGKALELAFRRATAAEASEIRLHFRMDRGWTRTAVTATSSERDKSITQTAAGSASWDWREKRALFTGRSQYNSAGATLHMFLDDNGNGVMDRGEVPITNYAVRLDRVAGMNEGRPGTVFISDLAAHRNYRARLVAGRNANPLWLPYFETFSFVTDPNRFKPIAVPFFTAGVIEGSVLRVVAGREQAIAGLRIRVKAADGTEISVPVFGDGSFYHVGLRPGSYELRVDESQLAALGLVASPQLRHIELRPDREGDVAGALDFVLAAAEER